MKAQQRPRPLRAAVRIKPLTPHHHTAAHQIARDGDHVQVQCKCGRTWWHYA